MILFKFALTNPGQLDSQTARSPCDGGFIFDVTDPVQCLIFGLTTATIARKKVHIVLVYEG